MKVRIVEKYFEGRKTYQIQVKILIFWFDRSLIFHNSGYIYNSCEEAENHLLDHKKIYSRVVYEMDDSLERG